MSKLPQRREIPLADTWDLSSLFASDEAWEETFERFEQQIDAFAPYRGRLGSSPEVLAEFLELDVEVDRLAERLGIYAFLKSTEDQTNSQFQRMVGRFQRVATRAGEATSFLGPEILAIPSDAMQSLLESEQLAAFRLALERLLRYRAHTLSESEEKLLAMQGEMAGAAGNIFRKLMDADMKFGMLEDETGELRELSNASFSQFLQSPSREVRRRAFQQYYAEYVEHENSLAASLAGSVHKDVYYARARGYESALVKALFPDDVPMSVYDNLIATVRAHLPSIHAYLDLRRRKMGLESIHMYDTYVPLLAEMKRTTSWDDAVELVLASLKPLGDEYCSVLANGLRGRWCDKYPNRHKQSGAFSCGSFDADPYIMMNYKPDVFEDVFTLAHEAGHSMHSYFSARSQPFQYYNYTIFVAEVASTFNEELLSHHLLERAASNQERAYLLNRNIDAIRGTIIRQTMFAEFEKIIHEMTESGEPLTVESLKSTYGDLLGAYFGPDFEIDEELKLEGMRIPHFYRAFYVYKYATGLSAAIALSRRVVRGGSAELNDYLKFLRGGCSQYPLELLEQAGVDMRKPEPIATALTHFAEMVDELDQLI